MVEAPKHTLMDVNTWANERRQRKRTGATVVVGWQKYVGEFEDDLQSGEGMLTWPNAQKYVGEFKNDKPNGQGTYSFPGGAKYVGEIKDGLYNGQGTYTSAEGWDAIGRMEKWKIREG